MIDCMILSRSREKPKALIYGMARLLWCALAPLGLVFLPETSRLWQNRVPKAERLESLRLHLEKLQRTVATTKTWRTMEPTAFCEALERQMELHFPEQSEVWRWASKRRIKGLDLMCYIAYSLLFSEI